MNGYWYPDGLERCLTGVGLRGFSLNCREGDQHEFRPTGDLEMDHPRSGGLTGSNAAGDCVHGSLMV